MSTKGTTTETTLVAKFQVTVNGTSVKLTSDDVAKIVKAHERAMGKLVAKAKADAAKAKKAAQVAQKIAAGNAAIANRKANAAEVTRTQKASKVLSPVAMLRATDAQQQKAVDLTFERQALANEWAKAYTRAFDRMVAQGAYNGKDKNDYARNNAALRDDAEVKGIEKRIAKVEAALAKVAPNGLTYREIAAKLAKGEIAKSPKLTNPKVAA